LELPFVPNVTKNHIPRIPPLEKALRLKNEESMSENDANNMEDDHYHSKTQKIILLPDSGKSCI